MCTYNYPISYFSKQRIYVKLWPFSLTDRDKEHNICIYYVSQSESSNCQAAAFKPRRGQRLMVIARLLDKTSDRVRQCRVAASRNKNMGSISPAPRSIGILIFILLGSTIHDVAQ